MRAAGSAGAKSRNEIRFAHLLDGERVPAPLLNVRVAGFEVDAHWPECRLAVRSTGRSSAPANAQR